MRLRDLKQIMTHATIAFINNDFRGHTSATGFSLVWVDLGSVSVFLVESGLV